MPGPSLPADEWRTRARAFAEREVAPHADEIDRTDRLPDGLLPKLASSGLLGLGLPVEWGGQGGDARCTVAALEELSVASAAVATLVGVHLSVCAQPIAQWGTEAQKERFLRPLAEGRWLGAFGLTEPSVGSDAGHLSTRYARVAGGFELNGTKMFITNAVTGDLVLLFATHDPSLGPAGISGFLVPKGAPGFQVAQRLDKLGLRGSETTELVLDHVQLNADHLLGLEGQGLRIALGALTTGRVGIAACALGVARAAFEEMRANAQAEPADWKRDLVARSYATLRAASALLGSAAEAKDLDRPFVDEASCAKLVASQAAVEIAGHGIDVAGPRGALQGARAERLLRDARVFPIVEGTTEIQELILGRDLLGR